MARIGLELLVVYIMSTLYPVSGYSNLQIDPRYVTVFDEPKSPRTPEDSPVRYDQPFTPGPATSIPNRPFPRRNLFQRTSAEPARLDGGPISLYSDEVLDPEPFPRL